MNESRNKIPLSVVYIKQFSSLKASNTLSKTMDKRTPINWDHKTDNYHFGNNCQEFKLKLIKRDKEIPFILIKGTIKQEYITILNNH